MYGLTVFPILPVGAYFVHFAYSTELPPDGVPVTVLRRPVPG
jgi:hypothetical protein